MIELFYFTSPNARKIHMALEELGLGYEIRWVDITRGDQFDPAFLRVNPNGKIPAIVDHDGPGGGAIALFESGAILLYLAEKAGRLLPTDPARRWEATCWVFWQVANQGPGAGNATHFLRSQPRCRSVGPSSRASAWSPPGTGCSPTPTSRSSTSSGNGGRRCPHPSTWSS